MLKSVGLEIIKLLEQRELQFEIRLASSKSVGKEMEAFGNIEKIQETKNDSFEDLDFAIFAGSDQTLEFAPIAREHGCVVIDNSSAFGWIKLFHL